MPISSVSAQSTTYSFTTTNSPSSATLDSGTISDYQDDLQRLESDAAKLDSLGGKKYRRELTKVSRDFAELADQINSDLGSLEELVLNESDAAAFLDVTQKFSAVSSQIATHLESSGRTGALATLNANTQQFTATVESLVAPPPPLTPVDEVDISDPPPEEPPVTPPVVEPPIVEPPIDEPLDEEPIQLDPQLAALKADFTKQLNAMEKRYQTEIDGLLEKLDSVTGQLTLLADLGSSGGNGNPLSNLGRPMGSILMRIDFLAQGGGMSMRNVNLFQRTAERASGALDKIMSVMGGDQKSAAQSMQDRLTESINRLGEAGYQPYQTLNALA